MLVKHVLKSFPTVWIGMTSYWLESPHYLINSKEGNSASARKLSSLAHKGVVLSIFALL